MAIPKIYRWDDAGAPSLTGGVAAASNWIGVLHACLVTGYGSKAAAGWVRQFIDGAGTLAVFQPASLEFGLQVNDTYNTSASSYQAADSWTNVSTPVGLWDTVQYVSKSATTTTAVVRPWMVLASDTFFVAFVWRSSTTSPTPSIVSDCSIFSCGKYVAFNTGTVLPNITLGLQGSSAEALAAVLDLNLNFTSSTIREVTFQRGLSGGTNASEKKGRALYTARVPYMSTVGYFSSSRSGTNGNEISSFSDGSYFYAPFMLVNYFGHILGRFPLFYGITGSIPSALRNSLVQDVVIEGKTWMLLCADTSSTFTSRSYYLIDAYTDSIP